MPYDIYRPMVAIDVAAVKATVDPSDGMARRNERNAASQMVRMGALNRASTRLKNAGSPRKMRLKPGSKGLSYLCHG